MSTSTEDQSGADRSSLSASPPWSIREINEASRGEFTERLGFLFENSPWVAERAWPDRPWESPRTLHRSLTGVVDRATPEEQLALIRAHPDLVGRAALTGRLGAASASEQRAAGLDPDRLTASEIKRFREGNALYRERFGFPFVVCAREKTKEQILAALDRRLRSDRDDEIATALAQIARIAWYRLADVVPAESSSNS